MYTIYVELVVMIEGPIRQFKEHYIIYFDNEQYIHMNSKDYDITSIRCITMLCCSDNIPHNILGYFTHLI